MKRKYFYLILGVTLLSFLVIIGFFVGHESEKVMAQTVQVEQPAFVSYISGLGIVEPESGNIAISSPLNRIVEKINVSVNEQVKKGDPLFQLNNHDLAAQLKIKQKEYDRALSNFQKLESFPRAEDLTIALENLNKAGAIFNEAKLEYCMTNCRGLSKQQRCSLMYKYQQAEADYLAAQAQFEKIQSGTWKPELNIAYQEVEQAKADIDAAQAELDRSIIKSPINGTVLQIKIHEGETLDPSKSAMVVGNIERLNLRVSIDQYNEARFHPDCPAVAFKHGDIETEYPLKFLHIEPLMVPKKYLTNELQEKVDTQTFEILYRIDKPDARLYIGEQMDVYIYFDQE